MMDETTNAAIEARADAILAEVEHDPQKFHAWLNEREGRRVQTTRWSTTVHEIVKEEADELHCSLNKLCAVPVIKRNMRRIARRVAEKEWAGGALPAPELPAADLART